MLYIPPKGAPRRLLPEERKNGIGIRVGDGVEVSYVRNLATHGYITASAGMLGFDSGIFVTATYNQIA